MEVCVEEWEIVICDVSFFQAQLPCHVGKIYCTVVIVFFF